MFSNRLSFFTPVTYQPIPNALFNKDLTTVAREWADDFFAWRDGHRAFVYDINNDGQSVQLVNCQKTSAWKTALKIALLATPIFPLMLLIKLHARFTTTFNITRDVPSKTTRNDLVPVYYQDRYVIKRDEITSRYTEICKKQGIVYQDATPLQKHALFFADQEGNFSHDSIQKAFVRLHSNKIIASIIATRIFNGVSRVMNITTPSFSIKDITKAMHPSDTQVFTRSGGFDEKQFEEMIKTYATPETSALSAENIGKLIAANHKRDSGKPNADIGREASEGELSMMLRMFSDCALVDKFGNTVPAITIARLKSLYTEGPILFEKVAANV